MACVGTVERVLQGRSVMFAIGESLRDERLRQGLALAAVEAELRIRSRYLAALEEERFELPPGVAYARVFLRGYAEFLGLDSRLFLSEYGARFEPVEEPLEVRRSAPAYRRPPLRPLAGIAAVLLLAGVVSVSVIAFVPRPHLRGSSSSTARGHRRESLDVLVHGDVRSRAPEAGSRPSARRGAGAAPGLVLATDKPGFTAVIEAGPAADGPFGSASAAATVARRTTFRLHAQPERYSVVWITKLDHVAHVDPERGENDAVVLTTRAKQNPR